MRAPAVPPAGIAHHLSLPLELEIASPAPKSPPINEPSLQSFISFFSV